MENDDGLRDHVFRILEDEGYAVLGAVDAEHAMFILERAAELPCVILLDMELPGMSAFELAGLLQEDSRFADVPVVVLAAPSDPPDPDGHLKGNVRVVKPVDAALLLRAVEDHCKTRPS